MSVGPPTTADVAALRCPVGAPASSEFLAEPVHLGHGVIALHSQPIVLTIERLRTLIHECTIRRELLAQPIPLRKKAVSLFGELGDHTLLVEQKR